MSKQSNPKVAPVPPTSEVGSGLQGGHSESEDEMPLQKSATTIRSETLERIKILEQRLLLASTSSPIPTASTFANVKLPTFDPTSKFADAEGWCTIVDLWVRKHNPDVMDLVMTLSQAMKGDAASWFISAKPTEKDWTALKAEFLAVFAKSVDPIEQFSEAVNGKTNTPEDTPLIDEMLHSMRTVLSLLKNRESDEAFAVLVACYFGSTRNEFVRRRYQTDRPKDAKSMCTMLQGRLGKRPALFPSGHHTGSKRRAISPSSKNEKAVHFHGKCHKCGRSGDRAKHCRNSRWSPPRTSRSSRDEESKTVTCYTCGKPGHISPSCPNASRKARSGEKHVNTCQVEALPVGQLKLKSGEIFPFLFDTGSDCSLLKESIATHFDGKRFSNLTTLKGVGCGFFICNTQILTVLNFKGFLSNCYSF